MSASSHSKLSSKEDLEEQENQCLYLSLKDPIVDEVRYQDSILGPFSKKPTREGKRGRQSMVKAPIAEQRVQLPKAVTYHCQQARLFTKAADANEGFIHLIGPQRGHIPIPLDALRDYTALHVRKDGWAIFLRQSDLSISVFCLVDPRPQNLIPTPPILGIKEGKVLSGSLIGETSLGSFEIFLVGAGYVENRLSGVLFHLGRGESSWVITEFPSFIPRKAVGPLLLDGGVLMSILDGSRLVTFNLHDFSVRMSGLGGFLRRGDCTLVKGTRGSIFAIQISEIPEDPPMVREIAGGDGWLMPTITRFEGPMPGRFFLTKNDIGFLLSGRSSYYANCLADHHIWLYVNGERGEGFDAHPDCSCSGGFLD